MSNKEAPVLRPGDRFRLAIKLQKQTLYFEVEIPKTGIQFEQETEPLVTQNPNSIIQLALPKTTRPTGRMLLTIPTMVVKAQESDDESN